MKPVTPTVFLYEEGVFMSEVRFKSRFVAWLFHILLNRSMDHAGSRGY